MPEIISNEPDLKFSMSCDSGTMRRQKTKVKIYTLGCFSIVVNGKTLSFNGKARQIPQNLIKLLIAHGKRGIAKQKVQDCLWDKEGDFAERVFDVTLHRARKIIGNDSILLNNSYLTLNESQVWVDCWDIEGKLNSLRYELFESNHEPNWQHWHNVLTEILHTYHGSFLLGETEVYLLAYRDKLRNRLMYAVLDYGKYLQKENNLELACMYYHWSIEIEPFIEKFYTELMRCQKQLGYLSLAAATYETCKTILKLEYNLAPGSELQALYDSIYKKNICTNC